MIASLPGGCSYLFWRAIGEKIPAIIYTFGTIALLPALGLMVFGTRGGYLEFLYFSSPLIFPIFFGSWFHRLSVKGTKRQNLSGYAPSILLMIAATGTSFLIGLRLLDNLRTPAAPIVDSLCLLSLVLAPSLAPLFVWFWQSLKLRQGYDI